MGAMHQASTRLAFATERQGLIDVTREVAEWVSASGIRDGLLTILCRHTSASLTIQENAAPAARRDIERWLARAAPEGSGYEHDDEGPDDMPAHLRSVLTGLTLSIPVSGGKIALGTWQGVYLCEHRAMPHRRELALHLIGE
jgi:secondary thiamine-phosphate synthase enzyme